MMARGARRPRPRPLQEPQHREKPRKAAEQMQLHHLQNQLHHLQNQQHPRRPPTARARLQPRLQLQLLLRARRGQRRDRRQTRSPKTGPPSQQIAVWLVVMKMMRKRMLRGEMTRYPHLILISPRSKPQHCLVCPEFFLCLAAWRHQIMIFQQELLALR